MSIPHPISNLPALVVIGGSAGGFDAVRSILAALPAEFPLPLVVVLHRAAGSDTLVGDGLARKTALRVVEPLDKEPLAGGTVYVAPADYHLLVEPGHVALSTDAAMSYSRPSLDVLFESAADAFGAAVVAVVLTGANADGARGAKRIVEAGGLVLVQDPATAESPAMPAAAREAAPGCEVLALENIPARLLELAAVRTWRVTNET